ncbi:MAG: dihydrolipoyl dehydrogenase [Elusimicrobiaceae bacterium]|nr:dihydrolipoyl dehydrogenase [Elusimicrobiaceae bacterium]
MKHIVIIGGGPAGYPAALKAASLGAKVTLIEKNKLGGVCLNCGCIPSKSLLDAAHRFQIARGVASLCADGGQETAEKLFELRDWERIKNRQQAAALKLTQGIGFLLKKAGVEVFSGEGSFVNEHTVRIKTIEGEKEIACDGVILATGSEAFFPAPFDAIKDQIYDNSTIFEMQTLPQSLIIVGGGVIGCEFADLMSSLGVEVSVVEMQSRILPQEDETAARTLFQALNKRGVKFCLGVRATKAEKTVDGFIITLDNGQIIQAQAVLAAIGRTVDLSSLHLETIGVEGSRKGVQVNPQTMQLKNNIYAAGDITGLMQLAHAATRQGEVAAVNLLGGSAVYHNDRVPRAIYTSPEIASVGITRAQAAERGLVVKAKKSFLLANGRAVAQDQTEGFFEILVEEGTDKILGATLVGANASELVHVVSVALAAHMTATELAEVIFAHPTLAESIGEAVHK